MLAIGAKLGRYEIRSKIGEGGRGEVYWVAATQEAPQLEPRVLGILRNELLDSSD
jgi:hypothetical protein